MALHTKYVWYKKLGGVYTNIGKLLTKELIREYAEH